jgi:hypothetical protein
MEKENDNKVLETEEKIPDESMDEVAGGARISTGIPPKGIKDFYLNNQKK